MTELGEVPFDQRPSTFLNHGLFAEAGTLASLHLKRDQQIPVLLAERDNEGYDEGKVSNTRFGSFPHSTLIGLPWGSQVKASAVDTGSRGRRAQDGTSAHNLKRKRETEADQVSTFNGKSDNATIKTAKDAASGFAHIFAPTPETWTMSLPHRTQVVYTADYSYILQRLRARPGDVLIEAGAGSGSFTHAAVRSVFNGYPSSEPSASQAGKVYSFEFHESRVKTLQDEIASHGLSPQVQVTHRDVYEDGFQIPNPTETAPTIQANAVFLDLPAPWLALPHLTRLSSKSSPSPLSPDTAICICTFSPCIEQVQRTVTALRAHGWVEIEMVEIAAKRIEVRRERVGLQEEGLRGVNVTPATVEESLTKLRELEKRAQIVVLQAHARADPHSKDEAQAAKERLERAEAGLLTKQQRLDAIKEAQSERKTYREGRLVHRVEPDIKTHTSYLVFAVLPREWSAEDEEKAQMMVETLQQEKETKSKKALKRELRATKLQNGEE